MTNHPRRRYSRVYVDRLADVLGKTVSQQTVQQDDGFVRKVWVATGQVGAYGMAAQAGDGCATLAELGRALEERIDRLEQNEDAAGRHHIGGLRPR